MAIIGNIPHFQTYPYVAKHSFPFGLGSRCLHAWKLALFFFLLKTAFFSPSHQVPGCSIGLCLEARPSVMGQERFFVNCIPVVNPYQLNIRHRTLIMWHGLSVFLIFCEMIFCAPDLSLSWLDAKSIVRRLAASRGYDNVDPASQHHSIWNDFGHTLW